MILFQPDYVTAERNCDEFAVDSGEVHYVVELPTGRLAVVDFDGLGDLDLYGISYYNDPAGEVW